MEHYCLGAFFNSRRSARGKWSPLPFGAPASLGGSACGSQILLPKCWEDGNPLLILNFLPIFTASVPPLCQSGLPLASIFYKCSAQILFPKCWEDGNIHCKCPAPSPIRTPPRLNFSQVFGSNPFPQVLGGWQPPSNPQFFTHIHCKCPAPSPIRTPPRLNFSQVFGSYPFPQVLGGWQPPSNPQFFTHIHCKCPARSPNRAPPRLNFFASVRLIFTASVPPIRQTGIPLASIFSQVFGSYSLQVSRPFANPDSPSPKFFTSVRLISFSPSVGRMATPF
jgi:hypothetical protein